MRTLGIDYGTKRLGLSLSDEDGLLASPLDMRLRKSFSQDISFIRDIIETSKVGEIVIGKPLNMDGSEGRMTEEVCTFASKLRQAYDIPVLLFDERMTTQEAQRVLIQANLSRKKRKNLKDSVSAVLILQGYLDSKRSAIRNGKPENTDA